jgi:hypothetical protein
LALFLIPVESRRKPMKTSPPNRREVQAPP